MWSKKNMSRHAYSPRLKCNILVKQFECVDTNTYNHHISRADPHARTTLPHVSCPIASCLMPHAKCTDMNVRPQNHKKSHQNMFCSYQ